MINTILWVFQDSAGHPACLTGGDVLIFAVMLLLLFLFCLLMAKRRKTCLRIRNYLLIPLVAAGGFTVYAIGYLHGGTANSLTALLTRSFLSTFHMFFLHSDLLEVCEEMHHNKIYMTFFSLIHFLAFFISFLVVVQLFGTHFLSWLRLKCAIPRRSYLLFSVNGASVALAQSLLARKEAGRLVVILDKQLKSRWKIGGHAGGKGKDAGAEEDREMLLEQLAKTDALLLNRSYSENTTFREAGIGKLLKRGEARLFLLSGDTARNLRLLLKMADEIKSGKGFRAKITFYVRVDDEGMAGLPEMQALPENVEIQTVNPAQLSALELITDYPPVDYVIPDPAEAAASKDFTAMILGFGETGSSVLRLLTEHGQFIGSEFRVTVVDKELNGRLGTFKIRYPGIEHYAVEYISADVNSVVFRDILRAKLDTLDYLVIALGNSDRNIRVAVDTGRFICQVAGREIDIFVKAGGASARGYMALSGLLPPYIHPFGAESTIFTEDLIVNETRWTLAKKMHDYYNRQKLTPQESTDCCEQLGDAWRQTALSGGILSGNPGEVKWEQLPEIRKISNLSAALHIVTKLKLAGLSPGRIKNLSSKARFLDLLGKKRLENLAKSEHLHWNATLFTHGWDSWTVISGDCPVNKDEKRKLHACLVSWEELQRIEKRFGIPYREYDRMYVENIYDWLQDPAIFEELKKQFSGEKTGNK